MKGIEMLMEHIHDITGSYADKEKLFAFLYRRKISAESFYFRLLTASRLVRQDYLLAFDEEDIWSDDE